MRSSRSLLAPQSSITVERSYDVSTYVLNPDINQQLAHPQTGGTMQASFAPDSTYTAIASIGRPSTARDRSSLLFDDTDEQACPSPSIHRAHDNLDIHQALRSRLAPFRQSKRWAKTYEDRDEEITALQKIPSKVELTSPADTPCQVSGAHTNVGGDNESEYHSSPFCGAVHIPGWHALKMHRLVRSRSVPTKIRKATRTKTPRRWKSSRSMRTRSQFTPKRAVLPRTVQDRTHRQEQPRKDLSKTPDRRTQIVSSETSLDSMVSAISNHVHLSSRERSISPVSSLHDYEKVKRFSQQCVDMLSGLDFGDEWRLSIFAPLSLPTRPNTTSSSAEKRGHTSQSQKALDLRDTAPTPQSLIQPYQPPAQSKDQKFCQPADGTADQSQQSSSLTSGKILQSEPSNHVHKDPKPEPVHALPAVKHKSSKSSFNKHLAQKFGRNLKNARSMDTLTKIEAQVVNDAPESVRQQLNEKSSSFTLSSSPKRQRPSGEPPERPLPDLPRTDENESRKGPQRSLSYAGSRKEKSLPNTTGMADPFVMATINSISTPPHKGQQRLRNNVPATRPIPDSNTHVCANRTSSTDDSSASNSDLINEGSRTPITDTPLTAFRAKGFISERSSRIQEMKKRHVAAWGHDSNNACIAAGTNDDNQIKDNASDVTPRAIPTPSMTGVTGTVDGASYQPCSGKAENKNRLEMSPICHLTPQFTFFNAASRLGTAIDPVVASGPVRSSSRASVLTRKEQQQQMLKGLQTAVSSPNLHRSSSVSEKPKQTLNRSQIMVIVDTNPHTASFRAATMSPSPAMVSSDRKKTRLVRNQSVKKQTETVIATATVHQKDQPAQSSSVPRVVEIVKPPLSIQKKRSTCNINSQTGNRKPQATSAIEKSPEDTPSLTKSRTQSRLQNRRLVDSDDSEHEDAACLIPNMASPSSYSRSALRTPVRKFHSRKDTPLTNMLKEEVRRADEELETLKNYERRIEYLQAHLEQTLKVWGRMSQNGKRQYLSSTFGSERCSTSSPRLRLKDNDHVSIAASSVYSRPTSSQQPNQTATKTPTKLSENSIRERRSTSSPSSTSSTETDTDASVTIINGILERRTSGGSLTDPYDYDIPPPSRRSTAKNSVRNSIKDKSPRSLSIVTTANLDDLRARLHASRPPTIPIRRQSLQTSPSQRTSLSAVDPIESRAAANRLAVAPWEEHDPVRGNSSDGLESLEVHKDSLSTDQMDAMLCLGGDI